MLHTCTVNCGTPTTGGNVIAEDPDAPRVAQGTTVTFSCPSGQAYILTGPMTAVCGNDGLWEPDASNVECIGQCSTAVWGSFKQLLAWLPIHHLHECSIHYVMQMPFSHRYVSIL